MSSAALTTAFWTADTWSGLTSAGKSVDYACEERPQSRLADQARGTWFEFGLGHQSSCTSSASFGNIATTVQGYQLCLVSGRDSRRAQARQGLPPHQQSLDRRRVTGSCRSGEVGRARSWGTPMPARKREKAPPLDLSKPLPLLLTREQAAQVLNRSEKTIDRMIEDGALATARAYGRSVRIPRSAVEAFLVPEPGEPSASLDDHIRRGSA